MMNKKDLMKEENSIKGFDIFSGQPKSNRDNVSGDIHTGQACMNTHNRCCHSQKDFPL